VAEHRSSWPRNFKGAIVAAVISLVGKRLFGKSLRETLSRIERSGVNLRR